MRVKWTENISPPPGSLADQCSGGEAVILNFEGEVVTATQALLGKSNLLVALDDGRIVEVPHDRVRVVRQFVARKIEFT